jgi:predicted transcriptional regulator
VEEDKGLTIPQVAEQLGRSPRQIRRYILEGSLLARTIQGKFGPEYRIDTIPEALYKIIKDRKSESKTEAKTNEEQTHLALQMLDSITGEYKAKIQELEAVNLNLAIELGKERARREELENRIKLLPGPSAGPRRLFLNRIVGRFLK